jgi:two-component system, NtrC family, sensor histidine kinase KinB
VLLDVGALDRMVKDVLDVCSLAGGGLSLRKETTELRALVENVIARVTDVAERGRVFLEAPSPILVVLDDARIERVVANLVTNALKYALGVSGIVVRVERHAACARVSVIDAGPGMPATQMSGIFDKYTRTPGPRGCEGSGLGLYISKQIIEAHGGTIGVESLHGIGCHFFFELPL